MKSKPYVGISIVIILLLTSGILYLSNINEKEVRDPVGGVERPYYFRIELNHWSIKVIDLNMIEDLILEGSSKSKAFAQATYLGYLGKLERQSQVFLQIYSLDVQHGFAINEFDIRISILEITTDIDSTLPFFYNFVLPNSDTSVTAYCPVSCGLGHSNMKLRLDVGNGTENYGNLPVIWFFIINVLLAGAFLLLISSPFKQKVFLTKRIALSPKSTIPVFDLYDISSFTEKELIELRLGNVDLSKSGILIHTFEDQSFEAVRKKVASDKFGNNWKLIEF